jgi:hypothetical protein
MKAIKCNRPKFSNAFGRTWDECAKIVLTTGESFYAWIDTSWGTWSYFQHDGRWYKVKVTDMATLTVNGVSVK